MANDSTYKSVWIKEFLTGHVKQDNTNNTITKLERGKVTFKAKLKPLEEGKHRLAPVSSRICTFWKITLLKKYMSNGKRKWARMVVVYSENLFMKLYDETGEVYIIPSQARLNIESYSREMSFFELKELSTICNDINLRDFNDSLNIRVVEEIVPVDAFLLCSGYFDRVRSNTVPQFYGVKKRFLSGKLYLMDVNSEVVLNTQELFFNYKKAWERLMYIEEIGRHASTKNIFEQFMVLQQSEDYHTGLKGTVVVGLLRNGFNKPKQIPLSITLEAQYSVFEMDRSGKIIYFVVFVTITLLIIYLIRNVGI